MGRHTPRAATLGRLLAFVAALAMLVALPSAASAAGTITDFSVKRTQSLPSNVLNQLSNTTVLPPSVAGNPALAPVIGQLTNQLDPITKFYVASPLGFPASNPSIVPPAFIGLGADPACATASNPSGTATSNAAADTCDAFLRLVNGKHEHSPGAFPGLVTKASFTGAPSRFNLHLPPGALGNPFGAHQCYPDTTNAQGERDPAACDGHFPFLSGNGDNDPTETDGSKIGTGAILTATGPCSTELDPTPGVQLGDGCQGEILNFDPRALPNPDERTAPAALAIVLCKPPTGLVAPVTEVSPCATRNSLGRLATDVVYASAAPIDVAPRGDGDYGLDSSVDFTKLTAGGDVTDLELQQFGLIPQNILPCLGLPTAVTNVFPILQCATPGAPVDPRQDPAHATLALPFVFNPTSCITATATADTGDAATKSSWQIFPDQSRTAAQQAADRQFVEEECDAYPWNRREVDPENSTGTPHKIAVRDQPTVKPGTTAVDNNDKIGDDDTAPVETPSQIQARFFTPTRGGLEYQSHYKEIQLTLKNTSLSPALAGRPGFTVCRPEQFDAGAFESASCPNGSKLADLFAVTPLADGDTGPVPCTTFSTCSKVNPFVYAHFGCTGVDPEDPCANLQKHFDPADWATGNPGANLDPIGGDVWAGPQVAGHPNQFRIFAELTNGGRLRVKFQGIATADETTGEIHAVFDDLPQLPVFHVEQAFPGGDFAPLVSPSSCGDHKYLGELTPWSAARGDGATIGDVPPAAQPDDSITTVAAPNAPCSGARSFQPQLSLLADPFTAGQDTSLTTSITLPDRSDNLVAADVALPEGLLGALSTVPLCPRGKARAGDCPAASQIGTVDIAVGNGGSPIHTPGKVYFSEPGGEGELARITVVVPAKAGPFDLGSTIINELAVKLRQDGGKIGLDNVGRDKLPTILAGIPIRIRQLDLKIDRERFIRNPLTCDARTGTGHFESLGGQTADVSAPFTATGCDTLAFTPKVEASIGTAGEPASLDGHPPVSTVVTQPDHQAAIGRAVVSLPQGLNPNVVALGTLCSAAQLAANACPADTRVGTAKAFSPLLPDPLSGPVYLVDNPGGLPKLVIRLGGLLSLDLTGQSALQGGRLVTTLDGLPATPVSRFELSFGGGPRGLFTVSSSLCSGARAVDGSFDSLTGQHATSSQAAGLVGTCVKAASARRPSLSVRLSRVGRSPRLTVRARAGSSRLSTLRVTIPKGLAVKTKSIARGVAVSAGGKKVTGKQWSLSRSGVLTIRGLPKTGRSSITVTIGGGALQASKKLRSALPRLAFIGRLVDVKGGRYGYTVRVRPTR
jgi:hypothetical protein